MISPISIAGTFTCEDRGSRRETWRFREWELCCGDITWAYASSQAVTNVLGRFHIPFFGLIAKSP